MVLSNCRNHLLVVPWRRSYYSSGRRLRRRIVRNLLSPKLSGKRDLRRSTETSGIAEPERGRHGQYSSGCGLGGVERDDADVPNVARPCATCPLARSVAPTDQVISPNQP
ncbi:hypothetical protein PISMIDRAFT_680774 [Pisolithus microcarpus 441]|uniref:Uncharacterized protein n=1 Tax=Pisolithus microcarpus 441 TaxID=765257 RepID=A0A0C9Z7R4_9AGAM|nr:hypothetical protein PISMIDRAFT_680774 [Pisolithus microcarpus 441]